MIDYLFMIYLYLKQKNNQQIYSKIDNKKKQKDIYLLITFSLKTIDYAFEQNRL